MATQPPFAHHMVSATDTQAALTVGLDNPIDHPVMFRTRSFALVSVTRSPRQHILDPGRDRCLVGLNPGRPTRPDEPPS
jgi:hypothetical protein